MLEEIFVKYFLKEQTFIYICKMRVRDENKEALVKEQALALLVELGFTGFSMHKLAKAAQVSPATLYIYYKDKDDLIIQLGIEAGKKMTEATFENFSPDMPFEEGLWVQWKNRSKYWLENPIATAFHEQLKHSPFRPRIQETIAPNFKNIMGQFIKNAIDNRELLPLPLEVFWTVAYAPLFQLIKFHQEGQSIGERAFSLSEPIMRQTFELVIKALKP